MIVASTQRPVIVTSAILRWMNLKAIAMILDMFSGCDGPIYRSFRDLWQGNRVLCHRTASIRHPGGIGEGRQRGMVAEIGM